MCSHHANFLLTTLQAQHVISSSVGVCLSMVLHASQLGQYKQSVNSVCQHRSQYGLPLTLAGRWPQCSHTWRSGSGSFSWRAVLMVVYSITSPSRLSGLYSNGFSLQENKRFLVLQLGQLANLPSWMACPLNWAGALHRGQYRVWISCRLASIRRSYCSLASRCRHSISKSIRPPKLCTPQPNVNPVGCNSFTGASQCGQVFP